MNATRPAARTRGPRLGDAVELLDPAAGRPQQAAVESMVDGGYVVRCSGRALHGCADLRWFDGKRAWVRPVECHRTGAPDQARLELLAAWAAVTVRSSMRAPVDRFPLLVEVVQSDLTAKGRRYEMLCHDISATGCAAATAGSGPALGDLVRVAWNRGDEWGRVAPEWIDAQVKRAAVRPFGGSRVGLRFELSAERVSRSVLAWRDAWAYDAVRAAASAAAPETACAA